jgi:hypothetical protein
MNLKDLHEGLNSNGYICDRDLAASVLMAINTKPAAGAFLFGKAGSGKTFLPQVLGEVFNINTLGHDSFFFQCFPGTREEHLTVQLLPDEDNKSGIKKHSGVMVNAAIASRDRKVILVIDEWDKTRPSADAFLLDFLQSGRIIYGDVNETANMGNLMIFITLNDERDISEPLMRRLPKIDFPMPHPVLVKKALIESHGAHKHIENCVTLYRRCLISKMSKPCTIQELRQVLDAINLMGTDADWNAIVFQYVTKTEQNHALLKSVESVALTPIKDDNRITLNASNFDKSVSTGEDLKETIKSPSMPKMAAVRGYKDPIKTKKTIDLTVAFGAIKNNEKVYNDMVALTDNPFEDPANLRWSSVMGDTMAMNEPVPMHDVASVLENLWGSEGEVMIADGSVTLNDIRSLQRLSGFVITKYSASEVIGKYGDMLDLRWTPNTGLEIIVSLESGRNALELIISHWKYRYITIPEFKKRFGLPVYNADVHNKWGKMEADRIITSNIPSMKDLREYVKKNGEVVVYKDDTYFFFDNIAFGFIGTDNDFFSLVINGKFDASLVPMIREWVPSGELVLTKTNISVDFSFDDAIKKHGFIIAGGDKTAAFKKIGEGVTVVYKQGLVSIGTKLQGAFTKEMIDNVIDQIDNEIEVQNAIA